MGGTNSVLTIPSQTPSEDVLYLQQVFSMVDNVNFQQEEEEEENEQENDTMLKTKILHCSSLGATLFFVPTINHHPHRLVWDLNSKTMTSLMDELSPPPKNNCRGGSVTTSFLSTISTTTTSFPCCEIILPSQTILLLIPSDIVSTSEGRHVIAQKLQQSQPPKLQPPKLQSPTMSSVSSTTSTISAASGGDGGGDDAAVATTLDDLSSPLNNNNNNNNNGYQQRHQKEEEANNDDEKPDSMPKGESSSSSQQQQQQQQQQLQPPPSPNPCPDPMIPSLQVEMMQQGGTYTPNFPLNSQQPIPFETDLFIGHTLIVIRPPSETGSKTDRGGVSVDPYWNERLFSKKNRRLVIQLQGKFKRQPKGMIYAGAQISNPLQLGLVTRGLVNILLRFIEGFNPNVHYSYGYGYQSQNDDNNNNLNKKKTKKNKEKNTTTTTTEDTTDTTQKMEYAHIVVPAYTFFDRVIATPPNEEPPILGDFIDEKWNESKESIQARRSCKNETGNWNTTDTYSFSFYSMYIDLPTWSLVKLPVSGNIALQTFWGQSLLNICMYENQQEQEPQQEQQVTRSNNGKHWESLNTYAFSLQVKFLDFDGGAARRNRNSISNVKLNGIANRSNNSNTNTTTEKQTTALATSPNNNTSKAQEKVAEVEEEEEEEDILRWSGNTRPRPFIRQATMPTTPSSMELENNVFDTSSMGSGSNSISPQRRGMQHSESAVFRMNSDDDPEVDEYYFDAGESEHDLDTPDDFFDVFIGQEEPSSSSSSKASRSSSSQVTTENNSLGSRGTFNSSPQSMSPDELLRHIDDACPFWVEVCASRGGGYNKVFAIVDQKTDELKLRTEQSCKDLLSDSREIRKVLDATFSPRLSSTERTRRALGVAILLSTTSSFDAGGLGSPVSGKKMNDFFSAQSTQDQKFLQRSKPTMIALPEKDILQSSSFVARAISDRHWIEEWATVSNKRMSFFNPDKRRPHFNVPFSTITTIAALEAEAVPLRMVVPTATTVGGSDGKNSNLYSFLAVQTVGRTVYLMFRSETIRNEWLVTIGNSLPNRVELSDLNLTPSVETYVSSPILADMDNPAEEFMHKSSMWSCKHRRILNCAQFSLHSRAGGESNPLDLVKQALIKAMQVLEEETLQDFKQRRDFLVCAARLKNTTLDRLKNDTQKIVFFLNLYHVMVMHAYLVIGPPDHGLQWINYFSHIAYQVGDDIFSLTELEHCIIRARMSNPSQFLSRFLIPKSQYRMALTCSDHRLTFALNCGSMSAPEGIFIYKEDSLQDQLDAAVRLYLKHSVVVERNNKDVLVQLPRVCQWFLDDFGGTEESLLALVGRYLPSSIRSILSDSWLSVERRFDMKRVTIKYLNFSFECRPLTRAVRTEGK